MPLKEETMTSWTDFAGRARNLAVGPKPPYYTEFVFRGQADASWELIPPFVRLAGGLDIKKALEVELQALREFQRHAHLFLPPSKIHERDDLNIAS